MNYREFLDVRGIGKILLYLSSIVMATAVFFFFSWLCLSASVSHADPNTWYVSPYGNDQNSCMVSHEPCCSVQGALNKASGGDIINVAQGVYTDGIGTVAFITQNVKLYGGWNTSFTICDADVYPSILDAQGKGPVIILIGLNNPDPISPEIKGFVVINGNGTNVEYCTASRTGGCGGGIFGINVTPFILGNIIAHNVATTHSIGYGGGIHLEGSVSGGLIEGNVISNNMAAISSTDYISGWGGGISLYFTSVLIRDNVIVNNIASASRGQGFGGGIVLHHSTAQVVANEVISNIAGTLSPSPTWSGAGGGISVVQSNDGKASIISNTFKNNIASLSGHGFGGAIQIGNSNVLVSGNQLISNIGSIALENGDGGGLYARYGFWEIKNNYIMSNTSAILGQGFGGGCQLEHGQAYIEDNFVSGNTSTRAARPGYGGGINLLHCTNSVIRHNVIRDNLASDGGTGYGGGLSVRFKPVSIDGNYILYNRATNNAIYNSWGGGVRLERVMPVTLTNNIIAYNQAYTEGGGLYVYGDEFNTIFHAYAVLIHNTFAENVLVEGAAEGIYVTRNASISMTNNIVVSHSYGIFCEEGGGGVADHTLFYGNEISNTHGAVIHHHTIEAPPHFVDPINADFHIQLTSPALNRGTKTYVNYDIDGDIRPFDTQVDLGADEMHIALPPVQCIAGYTATVYVQGLFSPDGLAFDSSGNLYVAEESIGQVSRVGPGNIITPIIKGLENPEGITFDNAGNLYVVEDVENGRLLKLTPDGNVTSLLTGLDAPEGIVWTPEGTLYVTESTAQFVSNPFDHQTQIIAVFPTGLITPVLTNTIPWSYAGIEIGANGLLYVTNETSGLILESSSLVATYDSVLSIDPVTKKHSLLASGLVAPEGIRFALNKDFPLYVTEEGTGSGDGKLSRIDANGSATTICNGFYGVEDVISDKYGRLYVSDDGRGVIIKIEGTHFIKTYLPLVLQLSESVTDKLQGGKR
ncbi:MAG: right-handed parallel beta-helix repeat-containing protein [Anaerolineae bacterium]|nr:right-handed parallel beta-helix repeat-containing protein [Anaerolineae bacterium]